MAENEEAVTYTGEICRDVFGSWDDCDPGLYIGQEKIETILRRFEGQNVRLTIKTRETSEEV